MPMSGPLKWHGGKCYLASKIIALMPPHLHFVEPYAGGLAVLLAKNSEGVSEVVNDLNEELTNFWKVLQDEQLFVQFKRRVEAIPFSEVEYQDAGDPLARGLHQECGHNRENRAVAFFVLCRQSLAGRMDGFATLSKTRVRRGMNEQASAWLHAVEGLAAVHARLKRVVVLNRPALDAIRQQDGPDTLFYLDPPYLHETRATTGEYLHEMTPEQHAELLDVLTGLKGKFLLSGYHSGAYDRAAALHGLALPRVRPPQPGGRRQNETAHGGGGLVQLRPAGGAPTTRFTDGPAADAVVPQVAEWIGRRIMEASA